MGEEELLLVKIMLVQFVVFQSVNLEPRMFSFNSPFGACPDCDGLGSKLEVDVESCHSGLGFNTKSTCDCAMGTD